ncbi:MAG: hypothetical protein GY847_23645 [Proteobacteria bacterium]|nr:hypothetical protein [Pseudomonadota bacterium]
MMNNLRMPRWIDILVAIYLSPEQHRYSERLNRSVGCSLTHFRNTVALMAKHNLLEIHEGRKIKTLTLTERGQQIASSIMAIKSQLG